MTQMMMQPYKGYFTEGSALMVHPFSSDWYIGAWVLFFGSSHSPMYFNFL